MPEPGAPCFGTQQMELSGRCAEDPTGPDCEIFLDPAQVAGFAAGAFCPGFSLPFSDLCPTPEDRGYLIAEMSECMRDPTLRPDCFLYANASMQNGIEAACPGATLDAQEHAERARIVKAGMIAVAGLGGLFVLFKVLA